MQASLDPGAFWSPSSCLFTLWAPKARRVTLRLVGPVRREIAMERLHRGYYQARVEGIAPGQRYLYRLDNGPERPDPASRWQPDGVHAASAVVDPTFDWHDAGWQGIPLRDLILYELHVGTFTHEGTFDAAIGQLDRLRGLGVNAIQIMPVAQFPGGRNWGYDGTYPFAVQHSYGGVAGMKRLVDAAHRKGVAVYLDVVYNHLGPEGNYLREFGPYFSDQYRTPWGEPLNYDGHGADEVRHYFITNALRWQEEFHLDGLRLDSVPNIKDLSAYHILAEIADRCREKSWQLDRPFILIGESDMNDPKILRHRDHGGWGLDSQWADDLHHALHAYVTGERNGYYVDFGSLAALAKVYRDSYWIDGQYSAFRGRRYGAPASDRPAEQFVTFIQNHDQVGNRARGDRLSTLVDFETLKMLAAVLLTSPYVPMLFMGEEYGETAPFPFFVSHGDGRLIEAIRNGRRREFAAFLEWGDLFDVAAESTFQMAKLRVEQSETGRGKVMHDWYRELLRLRREVPALATGERDAVTVAASHSPDVLFVSRWRGDSRVEMAFHLGAEPAEIRWPLPPGTWRTLLDSADARWQGAGGVAETIGSEGVVTLRLPGRAAVVLGR